MSNARALRHYLRKGGVIAYPTESCFGLGCDPTSRLAVQRILRLKGRPQRKGLILIAADVTQLSPFIAPIGAEHQDKLNATWPGPYTWLMPVASKPFPWLTGKHPTIAVRVTAHPPAARLCKDAGTALVSTSANHSGGKAARTAKDCYRLFGNRIRVIPGMIGKRRKPSTILDLATGKTLRP